jgi:pentose-5-phosphate-3-epimerase
MLSDLHTYMNYLQVGLSVYLATRPATQTQRFITRAVNKVLKYREFRGKYTGLSKKMDGI